MTIFHISTNTGSISRCNAEPGNCPFGGEETHFEGLAAARAGFEKFMQGRILVSHSKTPEASAQGKGRGAATKKAKRPAPLVPPISLFDEEGSLEYQAALTAAKRFDAQVEEAINTKRDIFAQGGEEATWSPEYFKLIHKQKEAYFKRVKAKQELVAAMSEEQRRLYEADLAQKAAAKEERSRRWYESQGLVKGKASATGRHPEITEKNELPARETIRGYSGWTEGQIMGAVEQHMKTGLSRTEAYRKVWAEAPQRTDKPFVYIDLETASDNSEGKVDQGRYSNIIEVGYQKVWADGRVEEGSFLYDVPQSFKEAGLGTGASHIHHITPEMVEAKSVFMEDAAAQRSLVETLDNSILCAHNANFEHSQLRYNLFGFRELVGSGRTEILDTLKVSKFFVPESKDYSNRAFVESQGGVYSDDAHRALADAKMSREAFEKHRSSLAKKP